MYGEEVYERQSVNASMAKVRQRLREIERMIECEEYPQEIRDEIRAIWVKPVAYPSVLGLGGMPQDALAQQQRQALGGFCAGSGTLGNSIFGNLFGGLI